MSKEEYERFVKEIKELNEEFYALPDEGPVPDEFYFKHRKVIDGLLESKKLTSEEFHNLTDEFQYKLIDNRDNIIPLE